MANCGLAFWGFGGVPVALGEPRIFGRIPGGGPLPTWPASGVEVVDRNAALSVALCRRTRGLGSTRSTRTLEAHG